MKNAALAPFCRSQFHLLPLPLLVLATISLLCPSRARAQVTFAGIQSTVGSGFSYPAGVAVDGHGNVYVADDSNNAVDEIVAVDGSIPSSPTIKAVGSGFSGPYGLAVDSGGNLYVANSGNNTVNEVVAVNGIIPSSPTILTLGTGFYQPEGVAVDSSGDVFVADTRNNAIKEIVAVSGSIPSSPTILTLGSGFYLPTGVAVDAGGDVYVADGVYSTLYEIHAVSGSIPSNPTITTVGSGFYYLISIAVDTSGNVFVADNNNDEVKEILAVGGSIPSSPTIITLGSGYSHPQGIAVDAHGNVFVGDSDNQRVEEIETESVNFGGQAIGAASVAQSLNFTVAGNTTVGSVGILTDGATNLDFASAAGTTCAATSYPSATNCIVSVTFKPAVAGARNGAVVFFSGANNTGTVLASVPVYGVGNGPQIAYGPSSAIAIDPTVNGLGLSGSPANTAVDGAGDLFIADFGNNRVLEIPAGGGTPTVIAPTVNGEGLNGPYGVAVDGAGNLYISDYFHSRIVEVPAGGGAATAFDPTANGTALSEPAELAVDGAGDLFIVDNANSRVIEVPAGGGAATAVDPTVNGVAVYYPLGATVDAAGDLFIADLNNNRVVEVPAGGGAAIAIDPTVNGEALSHPYGVTVDAAGDLFVADAGNNRIVEVPGGGGAPTAIDPTVNGEVLNSPFGVGLDSAGDLFVLDGGNNRVVELDRSQPPAVNFPTITAVGATDTTDGTMTAQVQNIGNQPLDFKSVSYPADFSAASDANPCTGSTSLNAGMECDLPIQFAPLHDGTLDEYLTLTDNNLDGTNVSQSIALSGSGPVTSFITFPSIPSQTFGTKVNLPASASSGLTVSFSSLTPSVCTVNLATASMIGLGTCTIQASQAGDDQYLPATDVDQSFKVFSEAEAISFPPIPATPLLAGTVSLSATATSGLTVSYASTTPAICSVAGSTVTLIAAGTCAIKATQTGDADYAAAMAVTRSFAVQKTAQTISFTAIPATPLLTGSVSLSATVSSGLAVSFTSTTSTVCSVSGSTVTLVESGTCSIKATQAGNNYYAAAMSVTRSFAVEKTAQTISFSTVAATPLSTGSVSLNATASSNLTVSFASKTSTTCSVSGNTVTLKAAGKCTIAATQAGSADYLAAPAVNQTFTIEAN
jgi:sugar lactone lactonase YvrE